MTCVPLADPGFFSGIWHGLIVAFTLPLSIFFDVHVLDPCRISGFYTFGFIIGILVCLYFASSMWKVFLVLLFVSFIVWFAILIATPVMWGVGIILGIALAAFIYDWLANGKWRQIKFRLPWKFSRH